jgi:hypothetical protein
MRFQGPAEHIRGRAKTLARLRVVLRKKLRRVQAANLYPRIALLRPKTRAPCPCS